MALTTVSLSPEHQEVDTLPGFTRRPVSLLLFLLYFSYNGTIGGKKMERAIQEELKKTAAKRDEVRDILKTLEAQERKDQYTITITRDRLAYWEGRFEGLQFALDHLRRE